MTESGKWEKELEEYVNPTLDEGNMQKSEK
jgi:hypothetical protein